MKPLFHFIAVVALFIFSNVYAYSFDQSVSEDSVCDYGMNMLAVAASASGNQMKRGEADVKTALSKHIAQSCRNGQSFRLGFRYTVAAGMNDMVYVLEELGARLCGADYRIQNYPHRFTVDGKPEYSYLLMCKITTMDSFRKWSAAPPAPKQQPAGNTPRKIDIFKDVENTLKDTPCKNPNGCIQVK